jgi:NADH dehydrogenase FAD-containing subunit
VTVHLGAKVTGVEENGDRRNYHLFQPLLYQVATAGLSPADIATPIRSLFRLQPMSACCSARSLACDLRPARS